MASLLKIFSSEKGYTLVETIIAGAILLSVLIPTVLFFGKVVISRTGRDLIVATQLAKAEMEKTTTFKIYKDDERLLKFDNKNWKITREVKNKLGLIEIRIKVFKEKKSRILVELKTLRIIK